MPDVKLAYFFEATYWHKGGRNPLKGFFIRKNTLPIPRIERRDVDVGFRLRASSSTAEKVDVLLFDNKLWWPVSFDEHPVNLEQLEVKLLDVMLDLLGIGPQAPFRPVLDDPAINRIHTEQADKVLSRAHQKISENLMVCDGLVYARGGEPVFVPATPSSALTPWSELVSCFVDPGTNRAADLCANGLRWQPGGCATRAVQACLRNGAFLTIGETRTATSDTGKSAAAIEIATKAPNNNDALELQIDACFRELWSLKNSVAWASAAFSFAKDPLRRSMARELKQMADEIVDRPISDDGSNDWETTVERADLIGYFVAFVDNTGMDFHRADFLHECRQTIERFERSGYRARANPSRFLTRQENDALVSLSA
jgi:hypothetical protein